MVTFPGFNISFYINPILCNICGINIYWYSVILVFAIAISVILCCKASLKFDIKNDFLLETLIYVIIFGIIGARLYYVIFNFKYYVENPLKILQIRDGGLAIYGGLIAGAVTILYRCKKKNVNYLDFFDCIAPYVALRTSDW